MATRAARGEVGSGHQPAYVSHSSGIQVVVTSFGYLHGDPPKADIVVDVRNYLLDPHVDPAFRALTGHDTAVMERVLAIPGAQGLIDALVAAAAALLPGACNTGRLVQIAVSCAGGRHRSVVIKAVTPAWIRP